MKLRPLNDRVLVKRVPEETKTAGGLYIPETAKEKPARGVVVAVGPGKILENGQLSPMQVKVGDRVILKNWGGEKVELDKEEYKIMSQDDILAIIE